VNEAYYEFDYGWTPLEVKPAFSAFVGILSCLDGYMNIALEQTEEWVNGQLKNKYGDAFIRGNNGNYYNENTVYELV